MHNGAWQRSTSAPTSQERQASPDAPAQEREFSAALSQWRHLRLLGIGLLLLVGLAAVYSHYLAGQLTETISRMTMLREAAEQSRRFHGYVVDLETGYRGFLLTGDRRQLSSYRDARAELPERMILLEDLLRRREDLQPLLAELRMALERRLAEKAAVLDRYDAEGRAAALQLHEDELGQYQLDALRRSSEALERELNIAVGRERVAMNRLIGIRTAATNLMLVIVAVIGVLAMLLGKRHFEALRRQAQLTVEIERSQYKSDVKSTFLAHVSHEIRTPMNAIFGFSGLLHDRLHDPVNRRYIDAIMASARSLLGLINDLLDLSKIESGKIEIAHAPVNPRDIIDGVTTMFSQQAENKGIVLRVQIDPGMPPALLVDSDRVRQMLVNLVSNAVKFTESGEVLVRARAEPGTAADTVNCVLEVQDSGPGIDPADIETIFEPFIRGQRHAGNTPGGTGLGLSITRLLARAMGGDVVVQSRPGEGALFAIMLPDVRITAEPRHSTGGRSVRLRDLAPLRVLVVDDTELNRRVMQALFAETPHAVRVAASAPEALRLIDVELPDVVLLDIRMPGMDGIEMARRLRGNARTRDMRLISVTASNFGSDAEIAALFDGMVLKPLTEGALASELARCFGGIGAIGSAPQSIQAAKQGEEDLLAELETLLAEAWPGVRDTLMLADVRRFAEQLEALGRRHAAASVQRYAGKLVGAAAGFDVAQIESLLAEFPTRVAELRARASTEVSSAI